MNATIMSNMNSLRAGLNFIYLNFGFKAVTDCPKA